MIFQPFKDSFFWRMLDVKHQLRNINYETRRGWFQGMWEVLFACYLFAHFFSVAVFGFLGVFSYVPTWNFSEGWSFGKILWLLSGIWREFLVEGNTLGFGGLLCTAVLPWLPWIQSCFFEPEFPIFPCEKAGFGVENCWCHLRTWSFFGQVSGFMRKESSDLLDYESRNLYKIMAFHKVSNRCSSRSVGVCVFTIHIYKFQVAKSFAHVFFLFSPIN